MRGMKAVQGNFLLHKHWDETLLGEKITDNCHGCDCWPSWGAVTRHGDLAGWWCSQAGQLS